MSPRQATHFLLLRQKKVSKEKATPLSASLRFAPGNLRCSLFGAHRGEWFGPSLRGRWKSNSPHTLQVRAMARTCSIPSARAEERSFRRKEGRACLSEASLRGPRLERAPQVARSEAQGRAQWGRLSFAYFSLARQRKVSRLPGRHPGSGFRTTATYRAKARCPHPNPLPAGRE
ncbi:MAG: hypothetical protein EOP82_24580 [Variovorax sp.]|nr:MAG: hypothetical protein EOP82_24580 [Variovorax sp.]